MRISIWTPLMKSHGERRRLYLFALPKLKRVQSHRHLVFRLQCPGRSTHRSRGRWAKTTASLTELSLSQDQTFRTRSTRVELVKHFPQITKSCSTLIVLAHIPIDTSFHAALKDLLHGLQDQRSASALAFHPVSSWHTTLYEGVTDRIRFRHSYPGDLPLDTSLGTCHAHVATRLAEFWHGLGNGAVGRMQGVGFEPVEDGLALTLHTTSPSQQGTMRSLRDRLSGTFKMRHPGHGRYSWHMALAYTLRHLTVEEVAATEAFLQDWTGR